MPIQLLSENGRMGLRSGGGRSACIYVFRLVSLVGVKVAIGPFRTRPMEEVFLYFGLKVSL